MPRNNSRIGRTAQAVGSSFESWVNGQNTHAKTLGMLAHIEKTQAKTAFIKGRLEYTKKGIADYVGTLEGGISLALEAKSTSARLFSRSEVDTLQEQHLTTVARAGGLSLLLVEFRSKKAPFYRRFAVPWLLVPWSVQRSAETVAADDIMEWLVKPDTCYLARWHKGGVSSSPNLNVRTYARE